MNELLRRLLFLPPQASTAAPGIDALHFAVISVTMLGAATVFLVAVVFVVRYRAADRPFTGTPDVRAPRWLEALFIAGTLGLFLLFWQIGFAQLVRLDRAPPGALEVHVTAKRWMWRFDRPDGARAIAVLTVPAGRPVKLLMTSRDVIHSFYVPDFRLKQDVVPGATTTLWFQADRPGRHQVLCAEYCGSEHSMMRAEILVVPAADYAASAGAGGARDMADEGREVAARKGCLRCHSTDGSPHIGPTWAGAFGSRVRLSDGSETVVDEAYLTASMMDPAARVVAGYLPVMPTYQGLLEPGETAALVEYIKSLAGRAP